MKIKCQSLASNIITFCNTYCSDSVLSIHNQIRLTVRREGTHVDIVKTFERGNTSVDFDNNLISHLD